MQAQVVALDPDFGIEGVGEKWSNGTSHSVGMEVDEFNRIYLFGGGLLSGLGYLDPTIVRYQADGLLDDSFGEEGKVILDMERGGLFRDVGFQSDGKILAVGSFVNMGYEFVLYRFHEDGRIDTSFAENGSRILYGWEAYAVLVQEDDKILVSGESSNRTRVVRFDSEGEIDYSFGDFGFATGTDTGSSGLVNNMAFDTAGNIIIYGESQHDLIVKKFDPNGQAVSGFGDEGTARFASATGHKLALWEAAMAIQDDGKIIVGFENASAGVYQGWGVLRFQIDGTLDASFGEGGVTLLPRVYHGRLFTVVDISIDQIGRIWLAGTSYTHNWPSDYLGGVALFTSTGDIATDFAENGIYIGLETARANGIEATESTLLIGGAYGFSTSRYRLDLVNSVQQSSHNTSLEVFPNPSSQESIFLEYELEYPGVYSLEVLALNGTLIQVSSVDLHDSRIIPIQLPDVPAGSYLLRLSRRGGKPYLKRIVVK